MSDEVTEYNLDAPPANPLESIFVLPEEVAADTRILGWYNEMVRQLRQEAAGIPMKAAQYTLMERIAFFYANMRYQEFNNPSMSAREKLQNIAAWQTMLDQFNRLLEKHNDKVMTEMLVTVQNILKDRLKLVSDPTERQALRRAYQEDFANIDL